MKKTFLLAAVTIISTFCLNAQTTDYKVVFDLTSKDTNDHKAVMRWVNEIAKTSPQAKIEVVMYSQGLSLVTRDKTIMSDAISKFAENKNIAFVVCEAAMRNQGIQKSQLLPGVQLVPDGIYEIISKQQQGWGYIKAKQ